jgi:hypothetical protein
MATGRLPSIRSPLPCQSVKKLSINTSASKKELLEKAFELYRENITRDINKVLKRPVCSFLRN